MNEPAQEFRKLPLLKVIRGAFSLSWQHRASLFRVSALPMLAVIAFTLAFNVARSEESDLLGWTLYLFYGLATCWLAVSVHRLVLLETSDASSLSADNLKRIGLFLAFLIGVWALYAGLALLIFSGLLNVLIGGYVPTGEKRRELPVPLEWLNTVAVVLAYYVVARFSLVFPAITTDRKPDLAAAWHASKRNGWRLAVVVGVLPWSLKKLTELFYRDGATDAEYAVLVVITVLFTLIEVVALSLSYLEITSPAPPPTDPPA